MTLSELDIIEIEIKIQLEHLAKIKATSETVDIYLSSAVTEYTRIHKAYIDLIKSGDAETQMEALKRALYIQWIASFEPSFITGITTSFEAMENTVGGLELKDYQFVYGYLDNIIKNNGLDEELKEMLSFYASWDFVFEYQNFKDYKYLHDFVFNTDHEKSYATLIRKRDLSHRGQMGDYFLSLNLSTENTNN